VAWRGERRRLNAHIHDRQTNTSTSDNGDAAVVAGVVLWFYK